ncbi:site-specific DNA-methyltransferase [bacterium]|nr:site-specific DNA-methyltransferase [bacterium]
MSYQIHHGDNREVLKNFADNSIDSVVTDPPYELGFMGKSWDATGVAYSVDLWQEVMRVLKPGGHLLAFSGSRTYHRMAVAIEDAGFEIRDQIMWIYGSGFPKSHDISKGIDKRAGAEREVVKTGFAYGISVGQEAQGYRPADYVSKQLSNEAITTEAKQWQGWGTALKPAHEPIVVARKPLIGTVAANVLTYGTGGLNIDGSRVGSEIVSTHHAPKGTFAGGEPNRGSDTSTYQNHTGRWPANVIHDGSDEVVELFPANAGGGHWAKTKVTGYGEFGGGKSEYFGQGEKDGKGSAARFFYCAKASKRDRNEGLDGFEVKAPPYESYRENLEAKGGDTPFAGAGRSGNQLKNHHPTVKPTELMRYLCRLVTPPGGIVLDPFMGSGSTGKAAMYEGFEFVGIELTDEYLPIAKARIEFAIEEMKGRLL